MRADILQSNDSVQVSVYVQQKFRIFDSWTYTKARRDRKCVNYYLCASNANKPVVEKAYLSVFRAEFPIRLAKQVEMELQRKASRSARVSRQDWEEHQADLLESAELLLKELKLWKEKRRYEKGDLFFSELQSRVAQFDPSLVNATDFQTEKELRRVARLSGKIERSHTELQAEFDAMIGIQQSAKVSFEAYHQDWGEINAVLSEDLKVGAWGSGSVVAALKHKGFDLEAQAAVGIGGELNLDGSCTWKKADHGLELSGNCNLFAGAQASADAKLSFRAKDKVKASLDLGAFAGVQASITGKCTFTYDNNALIEQEATASVQFGAGATLSGAIETSLFGATKFQFATSAALGFGHGVGSTTSIHFTEIYLAGRQDFRRLMYLPTLAKGYRMELTTQDQKNLHYLDKCIARIEQSVEELQGLIASSDKIPEDQKGLLAHMDVVSDDTLAY
jgi:hypothetical protein